MKGGGGPDLLGWVVGSKLAHPTLQRKPRKGMEGEPVLQTALSVWGSTLRSQPQHLSPEASSRGSVEVPVLTWALPWQVARGSGSGWLTQAGPDAEGARLDLPRPSALYWKNQASRSSRSVANLNFC